MKKEQRFTCNHFEVCDTNGLMDFLKDEGFVLKTVAYSDSDLIVHVLTRTHGILHFFVRGAKNSKKRFAGGVLQPPHLISFQSNKVKLERHKEESKLISLKEAKLINDFSKVRESYQSLKTLALLVKVIQSSEDSYEALFNHFGGALTALPEASSHRRFLSHFVVRHLYLEGVLPAKEELREFVETPMTQHKELTQVSDKTADSEAALASYFFHEYSSRREELKWPR